MDNRSWPDVPARCLVLVPVGSFEQHGPHLPLHTDTTIATAVAQQVATRLGADGPVFVAPPVAYGASGEHQSFAGTLSIGTEALRHLLVELIRSVSTWAARTVLVNGHGGNLTALEAAVRQLRVEGHDVAWVACTVPAGDAHAGHVETSVMLQLAGPDVDMARAAAGNRESLARLMPALVAGGVAAVSANGVLGDPRGASAAEGARILTTMVEDVTARIRAGHPDPRGCLSQVDPAPGDTVPGDTVPVESGSARP